MDTKESVRHEVSRSRSRSKGDCTSNSPSEESVHFAYQIGETLGDYRITGHLGDGTFGRVLQIQKADQPPLAVKVIKNVRRYIKSAKIEGRILKDVNERGRLSGATSRIVQYLESFYHDNRLCMVFERLSVSLYDQLKKRQYRGLRLEEVQWISRQMLEGLQFLHSQGIIHTDLKPENVLYSLDQKSVKIIDLGGATYHSDCREGIIDTRQYRSPEVTLDCEDWTSKSDVWSLACIMIEIATGQQFFNTHSEKEHLFMIEELVSPLPYHMVRTSPNFSKMFRLLDGHNEGFLAKYYLSQRSKQYVQMAKSLKEQFPLKKSAYRLFYQLLKGMLAVDPEERVSCKQALSHPFFSEVLQ